MLWTILIFGCIIIKFLPSSKFIVLLLNDTHVYKLSIMNELINSNLFRLSVCRSMLMPLICDQIKTNWENNQAVNSKMFDVVAYY